MFSMAPRFSSPVSVIGLGSFSPGSHSSLQRFHAQRSLHPKKEAIVVMWSLELEQRAPKAEVMWWQSFRLHPGQLGLYRNASPSWAPISSPVLPYLMHSTTYSTPHCLRNQKVFLAVEIICALPICRGNEVDISRALLDGVESERLVGRN